MGRAVEDAVGLGVLACGRVGVGTGAIGDVGVGVAVFVGGKSLVGTAVGSTGRAVGVAVGCVVAVSIGV